MLNNYLPVGSKVPFVYNCKQYSGMIIERDTYSSRVIAEIDGETKTITLPNTSLCVVQC